MLKSTFQHLKGISKKREQEIWAKGILTWDIYKQKINEQLMSTDKNKVCHILTETEHAYKNKDISFFKENLSSAEYYRIALEYPDDVIFLDIETTGLSLYYDKITIVGWSLGNRYGVYQSGGDPSLLRSDLSAAKVMVTFNGTMFDLKFLKKHFKSLALPAIHLDLRYFAKKVGLTGGQKAIETMLGLHRLSGIRNILGEAAPILWHKYRRGEKKALRRLIEYNHADVEGMKTILDESIIRFLKKEKIPKVIRKNPTFRKNRSRIKWGRGKPDHTTHKVYLENFKGSVKPLITYHDLNEICPLNEICIIGIDLVSTEERESGYCILTGNTAKTYRIKTDQEMIDIAQQNNVSLVSIDSPLSIPQGRTDYFDNDPKRTEFGITRLCERQLKKRGINSYPALIPSMQKLTKRGVELAGKFRASGIPVIESYPGAAQDIMSIPRKQAGLKYLTDGIAEFGIQGDYITDASISHDELDAITSAIVGHFYWADMYEKLGNEEENYLIIPDLNAQHEHSLQHKIIISGEIAAGKTTAADHLGKSGFLTTRYSKVLENILSEE
ncbi:MAG: ribonuclease H-like domain-containing protein, partial [Pseudomonadota bacterium]